MQRTHDKALVTLIIGEPYTADFMTHALPGWRRYADRHGYDIVALTELIDKDCDFSRKSINWQALLICTIPQLRDYDRLVWVDSDILINADLAPCIVSTMRTDRMGVVDFGAGFPDEAAFLGVKARSEMLRALARLALKGEHETWLTLNGTAEGYYAKLPPDPKVTRFLNLGVFVIDPNRHGDFLAEFYHRYTEDFEDAYQLPLAYDLQAADMAEFLDPRFNTIWTLEMARHYPFLFEMYLERDGRYVNRRASELFKACVTTAFRNTFFLHFAGKKRNPLVVDGYRLADTETPLLANVLFPGQEEEVDRLLDIGYGDSGPTATLRYL